MFMWIESSYSNPLLSLHVVGQGQQFTEDLDGAGCGDVGRVRRYQPVLRHSDRAIRSVT